MKSNTRVAAVVVTYNRLDMLKLCLEQLYQQTQPFDQLFLVDNASTDGTADWVRGSKYHAMSNFHYYHMDQNLGGAGGFAFGVEVAMRQTFDWLLLLDDDAMCQPDCLAELLACPSAQDPQVGVLATKVLDAEGNFASMNWPATYDFGRGTLYPIAEPIMHEPVVAVDASSFVGFMVRTAVVKQVGLPNQQFFIHFDDVEYALRIRRAGYQIKMIGSSVIIHKITSMKQASVIQMKHLWKHYYGRRNELYTGLRIVPWPNKILYLVRKFVKLLVETLQNLRLDQPLKRIAIDWRAFGDGLFGRLGKRISPG